MIYVKMDIAPNNLFQNNYNHTNIQVARKLQGQEITIAIKRAKKLN